MTHLSLTNNIALEIFGERIRQQVKWGEQNHDAKGWLPILTEELGEVAKAINENGNTREELIHVAAVAVAWAECIDRNKKQ